MKKRNIFISTILIFSLCLFFGAPFIMANRNNDMITSYRDKNDDIIINEERPPLSNGEIEIPQEAKDVVTYINEYRTQNGLNVLEINNELCFYSSIRVEEIKTVWSHTRPEGSNGYDLIPQDRYAGENLARKFQVPDKVFNAWINSPSHLANIVNVNYTQIGIAYSNGYWVTMFSS